MLHEELEPGQDVEWIITPGLFPVVQSFVALWKSLCSEAVRTGRRVPIMICAPSGTGKSMFLQIAKRLFQKEDAGRKPFRLNCAAFPASLIESELFGHVKGAIPGAAGDKEGIIEKASEGLLILEEVGELPLDVQCKLSIFMQERIFYPVGARRSKRAEDIQIIGTTSKGKTELSEDFWFRFFPFFIPPIYKRRLDTLFYIGRWYPDILESLLPWEVMTLIAYNWPGNVRELQRVARKIRWQRDLGTWGEGPIPHSLASSCLYGGGFFGDDVTGLDTLAAARLVRKLKELGVDVETIEQTLNKSGLGLDISQESRPVFSSGSPSFHVKEEVEKEHGLRAYAPVETFRRISEGFSLFCTLFGEDEFGDKNALDVEVGRYSLPRLHPKEVSKKVQRLIKQAYEFRLGVKLAGDMDMLPEPDTPEYATFIEQVSNLFKAKDGSALDLLSLKEDELLRTYYQALLDRSAGIQSEVARKAGVPKSTARNRLKRYRLI
jgi:DNA-binding NtrC family response regulator